MNLKQLHITAFRGISKMDFDGLDSNVNLFLGENGAGKSSILDALDTLLSWFVAKMINRTNKGHAITDDDVNISQSESILSLQLDDNRTKWTVSRSKESKNTKADVASLVNYVETNFSNLEMPTVPVIVHYKVNRAVTEIPLKVSSNEIRRSKTDIYKETLQGNVSFKSFFDWFRQQEDIENEYRIENSDYRDFKLQAVRTAMENIFPGYSNLKVRRNPLSLLISKHSDTLKLNQLSDGEKCYISLVCHLARRLAEANSANNPLEGNGIVLIDEIDLHLHPKWQLEVVSKLKKTFPNCQFFITTHSPLVTSDNQGNTYEIQNGEIVENNYFSPYGQTSEKILSEMFDTFSTRSIGIQNKINDTYRQIKSGDFAEAQANIDALSKIIDRDDKEITALNLELLLQKKLRK